MTPWKITQLKVLPDYRLEVVFRDGTSGIVDLSNEPFDGVFVPLVDGMSHAQACREFGIHDDTLRKMLAHPEPPGYRQSQPRAKPVIAPFLPTIREILTHDQSVHKKQRHTVDQICSIA